MAVVGAATAGSEIARILAERGALVIVFEQNPRPYGKIEDGLPRWHVKQRHDEYEEINKRLDHPNIEFVPKTRMGRDLDFEDLRTRWGLSGIVLSHGAWRDRPFPVEGADDFIDKGLVYQNPLIYWFNHYLEKTYDGPRYELTPGVTVVGGGLASIDVVKVLQIETTIAALKARGIAADMLALEREGIEPVLHPHGLKYGDLGVAPCKLYYRRRVLDMPLSDIPPDAPAKRAEALKMARGKILEKAQRKFLFEFQELRAPSGIDRRRRLDGRRKFQPHRSRRRASANRAGEARNRSRRKTDHQLNRQHPRADPGNSPKRRGLHLRQSRDWPPDGRADRRVRGRQRADRQRQYQGLLESGTEIGIRVAEAYLGLSTEELKLAESARKEAASSADKIASSMSTRPKIAEPGVADLLKRVRDRQHAVGYEGNYRAWIKR